MLPPSASARSGLAAAPVTVVAEEVVMVNLQIWGENVSIRRKRGDSSLRARTTSVRRLKRLVRNVARTVSMSRKRRSGSGFRPRWDNGIGGRVDPAMRQRCRRMQRRITPFSCGRHPLIPLPRQNRRYDRTNALYLILCG